VIKRLLDIITAADPKVKSKKGRGGPGRKGDNGLNVNAILYRWILSQKAKDTTDLDPVIPLNSSPNPGFIKYLLSKGVSSDVAVATEQNLHASIRDYMRVPILDMPARVAVTINLIENTVKIVCVGNSTSHPPISFEITTDRYNQLKTRFSPSTDAEFHAALGALLMRYNVMISICPGYNGGCPVRLLSYLHTTLGINYELFASPLNVSLPNYCSAYNDIDKGFGSSGSFFENIKSLAKLGGAFEVNPPFTEEYLSLATHFILETLVESEAEDQIVPLTYVYIHPTWKDLYSFNDMVESPFKSCKLDFNRNNHYYESGKQHEPSQRESRLSGCDTSLIILQNSKARSVLPITKDIIAGIIDNFSKK
jgi:phosphorylated CTD-interacting factor 1